MDAQSTTRLWNIKGSVPQIVQLSNQNEVPEQHHPQPLSSGRSNLCWIGVQTLLQWCENIRGRAADRGTTKQRWCYRATGAEGYRAFRKSTARYEHNTIWSRLCPPGKEKVELVGFTVRSFHWTLLDSFKRNDCKIIESVPSLFTSFCCNTDGHVTLSAALTVYRSDHIDITVHTLHKGTNVTDTWGYNAVLFLLHVEANGVRKHCGYCMLCCFFVVLFFA